MNYKRKRDAKAWAELPVSETIATEQETEGTNNATENTIKRPAKDNGRNRRGSSKRVSKVG